MLKVAGYTLLELMIATALTSLLVLSFTMLTTTLTQQHARYQINLEQMQHLTLGMMLWRRELRKAGYQLNDMRSEIMPPVELSHFSPCEMSFSYQLSAGTWASRGYYLTDKKLMQCEAQASHSLSLGQLKASSGACYSLLDQDFYQVESFVCLSRSSPQGAQIIDLDIAISNRLFPTIREQVSLSTLSSGGI